MLTRSLDSRKAESGDSVRQSFMEEAKRIFNKAVKEHTRNADDNVGFMLKLSAGRIESLPFSEAHLKEVRSLIWETFQVLEDMRGVPENQEMRLGTITKMLETYGDPDSSFP